MLDSGWIYATLMLQFYEFCVYFTAHGGLLCNKSIYNTCVPVLCEWEHNFTLLNAYKGLLLYFFPYIILWVKPVIYLMPNAWRSMQFPVTVIFLQERWYLVYNNLVWDF